VVPALTKALDDPSPSVRGNAATALGQIGSKSATAIPKLTELLSDTNAYVRKTVGDRARTVLWRIEKDLTAKEEEPAKSVGQ